MGAITEKLGVIMTNGASGIWRLLGAAKLQSAPGADKPRYAADLMEVAASYLPYTLGVVI